MFDLQLALNKQKRKILEEKILKNCEEKWGDKSDFLKHCISRTEIMTIAKNNQDLILGFSLARTFSIPNSLAIGFLATRVLQKYRKHGIAKAMIKKMINYFMLTKVLLNFKGWFNSRYFVSVTANPVVFEILRKSLKILPSYDSRCPTKNETNIAQRFSDIFLSRDKFREEEFVLHNAFLNSAEFYIDTIPWSNNARTNSYLKNKINFKRGDGAVIIAKL